MLSMYAGDYHIIGGDFNFECADGNIGFDIFKDLVVDYNLKCCDNNVNNVINYTYIHETLNHKSWIDHFFVSDALLKSVICCDIIDTGENLSDHLPIYCTLHLDNITDTPLQISVRAKYRERWDKADLLSYYYKSGECLQSIVAPVTVLHCNTGCKCTNHAKLIDNYYFCIVNMLKLAAFDCVPKIPVKGLKPFWSDGLDRLKQISVDMHNLWRKIGSPRQGIINSARLRAKIDYKQAIKEAAADFERNNGDELNSLYAAKNTKDFWKLWSAKQPKTSQASVTVAGETNCAVIAEKFREFYSQIYVDSSKCNTSVDEFNSVFSGVTSHCERICIDVERIEDGVRMLKPCKAAGYDGLVGEHLLHSHPSIYVHLKLVFTMMLTHSHVPNAFGLGVVIPIIKNRHGDASAMDNYRPITLTPIISKVFESFLLKRFSKYMHTDDVQFGFKNKLGCSNAIFALRQVVEYFNERESNVYVASLDASKAFDRVNHYKLYTTLIRAGLPLYCVKTIICWYSRLSIIVRWNGCDSSNLSVLSGVRQGGIMSPSLFNLYVNCMIVKLRSANAGCRMSNIWLGCIMYADDLLLISASVIGLQSMLDDCATMGQEIGLKFNDTKSMCMCIGPLYKRPIAAMTLNDAVIPWVDSFKYLGVTIVAAKTFTIDLKEVRRKFYSSVNCVLSRCKFTSDLVKLQLLESHCLPILLYAMECLNLGTQQRKELNSWWNSVYRKIFSYNKWESVKQVIFYLGRLDLLHMFKLTQILFIKRLSSVSCNSVMDGLWYYYKYGKQLKQLQDACGLDIAWSNAKLKALSFVLFRNMCI